MGSVSWRTDRTIGKSIQLHPQHFDFYQLVNLLLNFERKGAAGEAEADTELPADDTGKIDRVLRMKADIRFDFPPSLVASYQAKKLTQQASVGVNYFGIAGIYGPLPQAYSEWLYREIADGKKEIAEFLDIFNHRLLSLRYQVKSRSRVSLSAGRPNTSPVASATNALMGFCNHELFRQLVVKPRLLQTYAGLLANCRTSVQVVKSLLSSVFSTPVRVEQLCGQWRRIEASDQSRIGSTGSNKALGINTVLGTRSWDQQGMITVTLGPLPYLRLLALMPGGSMHDQLVELLRFLSNRHWDCRVRLLIARAQLPPSEISGRDYSSARAESQGHGRALMRLGQTAWLKQSAGLDGETGFTVRVH